MIIYTCIFFKQHVYLICTFICYTSMNKHFFHSDEIAKMKEEEEKRIAQMTRMEFVKMTSAVSMEADSWTDATLEDVEAIDQMARGQMAPKYSLDSSVNAHSIPYTAKGERKFSYLHSENNC